MRIGYLPITDATPLLVAHHNGYFDQQGIRAEKPVLLRSWAQLVEAFIAGRQRGAPALADDGMGALRQRVPAVVAWNHVGGSG